MTFPYVYELPVRPVVQRGIAYLDEAHPGWRRVIQPSILSLALAHSCILGQLDAYERGLPPGRGDYYSYLTRHMHNDWWAYMHGFLTVTPGEVSPVPDIGLFDALHLTDEWLTVLGVENAHQRTQRDIAEFNVRLAEVVALFAATHERVQHVSEEELVLV